MKHLIICVALVFIFCAGSIAEELQHEVKKGETLYSISHEYNISLASLMAANDIDDPTTLSVGTLLTIPQVYIVKKGDSLYRIAHAYGLTVYELRELNDFPDGYSAIKEGDAITVPLSVDQPSSDMEQKSTASSDDSDSAETDVVGPDETDTAAATPIAPAATPSDAPFWPHNGNRRPSEGKFPGIEIVGNRGDLVYAVRTGTVVYSEQYRPFEWLVIVESEDGYNFVYGFVYGLSDAVLVNINDRITAGAEIGTIGPDPETGEALLFFTVWKHGDVIDPELAPRG